MSFWFSFYSLHHWAIFWIRPNIIQGYVPLTLLLNFHTTFYYNCSSPQRCGLPINLEILCRCSSKLMLNYYSVELTLFFINLFHDLLFVLLKILDYLLIFSLVLRRLPINKVIHESLLLFFHVFIFQFFIFILRFGRLFTNDVHHI